MAIKVKAIRAGEYGHYRDVGHVFEIQKEEHFHDSWMEKVEAPAKGKGLKGKPQELKPSDKESATLSDQDVI